MFPPQGLHRRDSLFSGAALPISKVIPGRLSSQFHFFHGFFIHVGDHYIKMTTSGPRRINHLPNLRAQNTLSAFSDLKFGVVFFGMAVFASFLAGRISANGILRKARRARTRPEREGFGKGSSSWRPKGGA